MEARTLFSLPDGTPLQPTAEQLVPHWGRLLYRGQDLIDAYLAFEPSGGEAGQEVFLGYQSEEDLFYVGFEGACVGVIALDADGRVTEHETIWSEREALFYGPHGLFEEVAGIPGMIVLRKD